MFKDTQEELERLEEELLAEDEQEQQQNAAEEMDPFDFSQFDQDIFDENAPTMVYPGGAGRFQQEMDAYQRRVKDMPPVHARNTDRVDEDVDEYSDEVWEPAPRKDHSVAYLTVLAVILTLAIVAVVAWWVLRFMRLGS